jgi:uncharacterized protein (DUF302 family)
MPQIIFQKKTKTKKQKNKKIIQKNNPKNALKVMQKNPQHIIILIPCV